MKKYLTTPESLVLILMLIFILFCIYERQDNIEEYKTETNRIQEIFKQFVAESTDIQYNKKEINDKYFQKFYNGKREVHGSFISDDAKMSLLEAFDGIALTTIMTVIETDKKRAMEYHHENKRYIEFMMARIPCSK